MTNNFVEADCPNIQIRALTQADLGQVAHLHAQAFPKSRSSQLGLPFLKKMYGWFLRRHPALCYVAQRGDLISGVVTGSIGGYGRSIFRFAWKEISWGLLTHPRLVFNGSAFLSAGSYLRGLLPPYNKPAVTPASSVCKASLASIAIIPESQGRGLGRLLMEAFESAARQQGATLLGLSVEKQNAAARRLYERCHWVLLSESDGSVYYTKSIQP